MFLFSCVLLYSFSSWTLLIKLCSGSRVNFITNVARFTNLRIDSNVLYYSVACWFVERGGWGGRGRRRKTTTMNHIFCKSPHRFLERWSVLSGKKTNTQIAYFQKGNEAHHSNYSLNLHVLLNLKWISCRQCTVRSFFFLIHPTVLYFLNGEFNPITFRVIIDMQKHTNAILLIALWLLFISIVSFSFCLCQHP